jgi:hypothetical protein
MQAGRQIVHVKDAVWRALLRSSRNNELHERLAKFLQLAVAERQVLVENMLAAQHAGEIDASTAQELRRQELDSRLRLMRSLLQVGEEVAALVGAESQQALREMWLSSVNSLLAIDEVWLSSVNSLLAIDDVWLSSMNSLLAMDEVRTLAGRIVCSQRNLCPALYRT